MKIGIRTEDKSEWERRTPLTPEDMAALQAEGLPVVVQASPQRAFTDLSLIHISEPTRL